jgi:YYY domain-containing protein
LAETVRWWAALELLALLSLPLCSRIFGALPDRGYTLSKGFGWLLASWVAWLLASAGLGGWWGAWATLGALAAVSFVLARRSWRRAGPGARRPATGWRLVAAVELAFALSFAALVALRGHVPAIQGTEKPMEYMLLQSAYASPSAPPEDLWLSGHPANYYYFGYFASAFLGRLAGAAPEVAFNLSLATVWATTLVGLGGLGWSALASTGGSTGARLIGAAVAPALVLLAGNPEGTRGWWRSYGQGEPFDWWSPSRVVYDTLPGRDVSSETINEFPAFSFLLGDLHPHVLAMPAFTLGLAVSLALALAAHGGWRERLALAAFGGLVVGWLYMTNSWDVPVIVLLLTLAAALGGAGATRRLATARAAAPAAVVLAVSMAAALPFVLGYAAPVNAAAQLPGALGRIPGLNAVGRSVGVVWWGGSDLGEFVRAWGWHAMLTAVAIAGAAGRVGRDGRRAAVWLALAAIPLALLLRSPVALLLPVCVVLLSLARSCDTPAMRWAWLLAAAGWGLVLLPELVYLRDAFESRMNTVFKFYYQAWQLLGLAVAVLLALQANRLGSAAGSPPNRWRAFAPALAAVGVVLLGLAYPVAGVRERAAGGYRGLDGAAFLAQQDPGAHAMAGWLRRNTAPGTVVLEATGEPYSLYGRLATFGGRPAVLGWANHERQWRAGQPELLAEVGVRAMDVQSLYAPGGRTGKRDLLRRYNVAYALYGTLERESQAEAGLPVQDPFEGWLPVAARHADTTLYRAR